MATAINYQSPLPQLLTSLLGQKQTSSSTSTANTTPLEQLFTSAMSASSAGVPEMQQLIASIFQEGATKVPELTQAFANATGSRTTGNSGLALSLGDLNRKLSTDAAVAILNNQNTNRQTASNAANAIAQATRGTTQTQTTKAGVNPLLLALGGSAINKLDKMKGLDWLKSASSGMAPVSDAIPTMVNEVSFPEFEQPLGDLGGIDTGGDYGVFDNLGVDAVSGLGNISFDGLDFGPDPMGIDFGFDAGFGTGPDFGSFDFGDFFADGGAVGKRTPRRGTDGGVLNVDKNISAMSPSQKTLLFGKGEQFGFNPGDDLSKLIMMFQAEAQRAPTAGISRDMNQQRILLQNLQNLIFNPGAFNSGSIWDASTPRTVEQINGYADGGAVTPQQRNRNYLGTATRQAPQVRASNFSQARRQSQREQSSLAGGEDYTGSGDATSVPGVVGTPSQNNAAALGFVTAMMAPALGIPGLATIANTVTGGKSLPSMALSNLLAMLGIGDTTDTASVSPDSVAAATGISGVNSGGLAGLGISLGLDGLDGTAATAPSGDTGSTGSGGSGSGVGADGSATSGTDGDSGVGSTGAYANGGAVKGPGTGTSDSIPARLSDGEYVIPADVVRRIGTNTLDRIMAGHVPAGVEMEDEDD